METVKESNQLFYSFMEKQKQNCEDLKNIQPLLIPKIVKVKWELLPPELKRQFFEQHSREQELKHQQQHKIDNELQLIRTKVKQNRKKIERPSRLHIESRRKSLGLVQKSKEALSSAKPLTIESSPQAQSQIKEVLPLDEPSTLIVNLTNQLMWVDLKDRLRLKYQLTDGIRSNRKLCYISVKRFGCINENSLVVYKRGNTKPSLELASKNKILIGCPVTNRGDTFFYAITFNTSTKAFALQIFLIVDEPHYFKSPVLKLQLTMLTEIMSVKKQLKMLEKLDLKPLHMFVYENFITLIWERGSAFKLNFANNKIVECNNIDPFNSPDTLYMQCGADILTFRNQQITLFNQELRPYRYISLSENINQIKDKIEQGQKRQDNAKKEKQSFLYFIRHNKFNSLKTDPIELNQLFEVPQNHTYVERNSAHLLYSRRTILVLDCNTWTVSNKCTF